MNKAPLASVTIGGNDRKMPAKPPHQQSTEFSSRAATKIRNSASVLSTLVEPYIEAAHDSEEGILITSGMLDQIVEIMRSRVKEKRTESLPFAASIDRTNPNTTVIAGTFPSSPRPRLSRSASMSSLGSQMSPNVSFSDHGSVSFLEDQTQPLIASHQDGGSPSNNVLSKISKIVPAPQSWKDAAMRVFDTIDKNKDGYLDRKEVKQALEELGEKDNRFHLIKRPIEFAGSLVDLGDKDADGKINRKQFLKMVRSGALNESATTDDNATPKKKPRPKALERSSRFASSLFLAPRDKSLKTPTIGNDKFLLHPKSLGEIVWGVLISLIIFVVMITMPLSFGWKEFGDSLLVYNTVIDGFFMLDVIKTFFTGSVGEDDSILMDAEKIRKKYLRGFFVFDLLSCIPLDLIFHLTPRTESFTAKNSVKLLKLLLVFKLFRFRRLKKAYDLAGTISRHIEAHLGGIRITDGFSKVTSLFFWALILAHWIGCFNFMLVQSYDFPDDSWVVAAGLDEETPVVQWSFALFKALAAMIVIGFETPPFTNVSCDTLTHWCQIEHWVTLGCLYIGAVFYSFLISYVIGILNTSYFAQTSFEEKFMQVDGWMRAKKMPTELRNQVMDNFRKFHLNGNLYDDSVLRFIVPSDLVDIHRVQAEQLLKRIPFFANLSESDGLIKELAFHMDRVVMSKNETIFGESVHGDSVCFIESGLVELYLPSCDDPNYRVIGELCFFGEVSPLFGTLRTAAARVKRDCVLFQIASHDFLEVLKDFPRASKALKKVALERLNRVQAYRHPDPDDVDELAKDDDIDTQDARVAKKENDQSDSGIVDKNHGGSITVATAVNPV